MCDADVFATTTVLHHLPRPELAMRRNWLPCESEVQSHRGLYFNITRRPTRPRKLPIPVAAQTDSMDYKTSGSLSMCAHLS